VVQIGSLTDIQQATPANFAKTNASQPVQIAAAANVEAEPVAGD